MEQSVRLGRIAGIEVGFNWSLIVVFVLISWSLAVARFPTQVPGQPESTYWIVRIATAVLFFASLLAHEVGHAAVARKAGVKVDGITLWLFGGVARLRGEAMSPGAELRIAAIGPAISLGLAAILGTLALLLAGTGAPGLLVGAFAWLGVVNAVLAVFNLVPAFPLDGGRVLRALLWRRSGDRLAATRTAARAGRVFAYVLIGLGVVEFLAGAGIGGLWFVFLGWLLLGAAQAEESHVLLRVKDVPPERRGEVTLGEIACGMEDVARVDPDDEAIRALEGMQRCADGRALVMDDGRLVGIVSPRDVQGALEIAGLRAA